jgi:hypothetical protein
MASVVEQSMEVLKRADDENRARSAEISGLRRQLAAADREKQIAVEAQARATNQAVHLGTEVDRRQQALDVVLKEVAVSKQMAGALRAENTRLKDQLERALLQTREVGSLLAAKAAAQHSSQHAPSSLAVLYVHQCFAFDVDVAPGVLHCLYHGTAALACPAISFMQLAALVEVIRVYDTPPAFTRVALPCTHETHALVCELIALVTGVTDVALSGVDDESAAPLVSTLALCERIVSLELPGLAVTADASLQVILRALNNRATLAAQKTCAPLVLRQLDLSGVADAAGQASLLLLRSQFLSELSLAGCAALDNATLAAVLAQCTALQRLDVSRCHGLTNEAANAVNLYTALTTLDVTGCEQITQLNFAHVVSLATDLAGVSIVNCPSLEVLPTPCVRFQVLRWAAPLLGSIVFQNVALTAREFTLLAASSALASVSLISCRVSSLDQLLKRLRRLCVLSAHGSKGICDADITALCSTVQSVDLTDNFGVTDKSLARLAEFTALREVTLKRCSNITDAGLACFEHHDKLEYLNLLGAKKVTVLAVHRLIAALPALATVVHETVLTPAVHVARLDDEEAERTSIRRQVRALDDKTLQLALTHGSPSRSATPHGSVSRPGTAGTVGSPMSSMTAPL